MKCTKCGREIAQGSKFCPNCGAQQSETPATERQQSEQPKPPQEPFTEPSAAPESTTKKKRGKGKRKVLIAAIAAVLLIALAAGALAIIPAPGNNIKLRFRTFDAGWNMAAGVTTDGYLYAWGDSMAKSPRLLDPNPDWVDVSLCNSTLSAGGSSQGYALKSDGSVWGFDNYTHQIEKVPSSVHIKQISAGMAPGTGDNGGVYGLDEKGKIWLGEGSSGFKQAESGSLSYNERAPYVAISAVSAAGGMKGSCGFAALDAQGNLYIYGNGRDGLQQQDGTWTVLSKGFALNAQGGFSKLNGMEGIESAGDVGTGQMETVTDSGDWVAVNSPDNTDGVALKADGSVWVWGDGRNTISSGPLKGAGKEMRQIKLYPGDNTKFSKVSVARSSDGLFMLDSTGLLEYWGDNLPDWVGVGGLFAGDSLAVTIQEPEQPSILMSWYLRASRGYVTRAKGESSPKMPTSAPQKPVAKKFDPAAYTPVIKAYQDFQQSDYLTFDPLITGAYLARYKDADGSTAGGGVDDITSVKLQYALKDINGDGTPELFIGETLDAGSGGVSQAIFDVWGYASGAPHLLYSLPDNTVGLRLLSDGAVELAGGRMGEYIDCVYELPRGASALSPKYLLRVSQPGSQQPVAFYKNISFENGYPDLSSGQQITSEQYAETTGRPSPKELAVDEVYIWAVDDNRSSIKSVQLDFAPVTSWPSSEGDAGNASEQTPVPKQAPVNLVNTLSDAQYEKWSTFFSNFSEVAFTDYDHSNYNIDKLIAFSIWHSYKNQGATSTGEESYPMKVSQEKVASDLKRYFGVTGFNNRSVHIITQANGTSSTQDYPYKNGAYYFMPADGAPLIWSQITALYDNGDGTFSAELQDYSTHNGPTANIYKRQKYWGAVPADDPWNGYQKGGRWTATIKASSIEVDPILLSCRPLK